MLKVFGVLITSKGMKTLYVLYVLVLTLCCPLYGQSLYERFPVKPEEGTALIIAYRGNYNIQALGSGSIYSAPITTNTASLQVPCLVTAYHMLHDPKTLVPYDGLLVKINMPSGSKPRYLKIPLKNDSPRNYWVSPAGYDLVAIPFPGNFLNGADLKNFQ